MKLSSRHITRCLGGLLMIFNYLDVCADNEIVINEIMPNNVDVIYDEDYRFPASWVELQNLSDRDVDIKDWYFSTSNKNLTMWRVPVKCVIPPNGFKVIFFDKEENVADDHLHADFELEHKSGQLFLVDKDGKTVVDQTENYREAPVNLSFGRCLSDIESWSWFRHATPNAANEDYCSEKRFAPEVIFDKKAGIYKNSVVLKLSAPKPYNESIYYTLDGSEPSECSDLYVEPLKIGKTTVVKAKVISDDILSKPSQVNTYIISSREISLPIISLSTDPIYLWDDTLGIYVEGKTGKYYDVIDREANYMTNRRRPFSMEYFVDGKSVVNQLCEARISGGYTRIFEVKSLKIYAKNRYGDNHFNYRFFSEKSSMEKKGYKSLLLRNGGNDYDLTILKDAYCQYWSAGKVDVDYQACQSAIVFINGEYWGIENIRETDNEDYFEENYGVKDIDLYENYILKAGTEDAYKELCRIVDEKPISHKKLSSAIDVNEFLNYMSLEAFAGNYDWPSNNHVFWRDRNKGKWRWLVKDMDGGFTYWPPTVDDDIRWVNFNPFHFLTRTEPYYSFNNAKWATQLLERILSDPIIERQFIERLAVQLGDIFHKDAVYHVIDSLSSIIEDEIPYHKERWNQSQSIWNSCMNQMPEWVEHRNDILYGMMSEFYSLGSEIPLEVVSSISSEKHVGHLSLCDQKLYRDQFDGKWFQNDSFIVKAQPKVDGVSFQKWIVRTRSAHHDESEVEVYANPLTIHTEDNLSYEVIALYDNMQYVPNTREYVSLYPNPVKDDLTIKRVNSLDSSQVYIYDFTGNLIKMDRCKELSMETKIDMKSLRSGIYIVKVVNDVTKEMTMFRVIKE